jgi:hypothetical protein
MFNKGFLFKVIFGLFGFAAVTGVIYMAFVKPFAPTYLNITIGSGSALDPCTPIIQFRDNSQNEYDFRIYRRNLGTLAFSLIQILPASPGKGTQLSYSDSPLPSGSYEYKVGAYNQFGESYTDVTPFTVVDSTTCAKIPSKDPSTLPMNPIIVSLSIINDCNVRISYRDNSTNEQGFKIVRSTANSGLIIVANLGPHAGIPATYDDKTNLPPGKYYYFINVYNQSGNSDSNVSAIEVTSVCNPTLKPGPTVDALVVPTAQKLSTNSCIWQSKANVFLRKGPNVGTYDRLVSVETGQSFPIIGQSEDGKFWAVEVSPGVAGYITKSENYSLTNGDCSNVPTLKDPPPPVIEMTPTKKPAGDNNGGDNNPVPATPCPVGAVCP